MSPLVGHCTFKLGLIRFKHKQLASQNCNSVDRFCHDCNGEASIVEVR